MTPCAHQSAHLPGDWLLEPMSRVVHELPRLNDFSRLGATQSAHPLADLPSQAGFGGRGAHNIYRPRANWRTL